jgi:putative ubiquitin-RnfH superfamily antitoxin RatB of RatAB toxin-antitoxin module
MSAELSIVVADARNDAVACVTVVVPAGATVAMALAAAGHGAAQALDVGVYGRRCTPDRPLAPGDRVEIYGPLHIDPKAARHQRVAQRRGAGRGKG